MRRRDLQVFTVGIGWSGSCLSLSWDWDCDALRGSRWTEMRGEEELALELLPLVKTKAW